MINTKNIKVSEGGNTSFTPKQLSPGVNLVTIKKIYLEKSRFKDSPNDLYLVLTLEGVPLGESFVGFLIDANDPLNKERFKGQSANVKYSEYSFRDWTTPSGIPVFRDQDILVALKILAEATESVVAFENIPSTPQDKNTIEELVEYIDKSKMFCGPFMYFCIAGKEFKNKAGYTAHELFLPKPSSSGIAFSKDESKVQKFNASVHIKKAVVKSDSNGVEPVNKAGGGSGGAQVNGGTTSTSPFKDEFQESMNMEVPLAKGIVSGNEDDELPFSLD